MTDSEKAKLFDEVVEILRARAPVGNGFAPEDVPKRLTELLAKLETVTGAAWRKNTYAG